MKLIVTEKPSVAVEFAKALDFDNHARHEGYLKYGEWVITWCVGHLISMSYPESYDLDLRRWKLDTLPFLPEKYRYEVLESTKKQYHTVTKYLNDPDIAVIYYAGDAAREGEYIQRLVRMYGGHNENAIEKRVWIDSQTKDEILRGIREAKPLSDYDALSDAAYMRAIEDYLFGINLSRAYTICYGGYLPEGNNVIAVGRVMSCALGMIVSRERLIRNTKEIPFYGVNAATKIGELEISAEWHAANESDYVKHPDLYKDKAFYNMQNAQELMKKCSDCSNGLILKKKSVSIEKQNAPFLFNLAELQGECTSVLKISPDRTLEIAQKLYERKLVTYPRTDARVLSTPVAKEIKKNISGLSLIVTVTGYVQEIISNGSYCNIGNSAYVDDSKISDHYAIIPTGEGTNYISLLSDLELNVYMMIVKRFLAIFYPPAVYKKILCEFITAKEEFVTGTKYLFSNGWLKIYGKSTEEITLYERMNSLVEGSIFPVKFSLTEGRTSPPKRYTTGSMVLAMENAGQLIEDAELRAQIKGSGIGTSATRAETIKKLITRNYIMSNDKTQVIRPTREGEIIFDMLELITPSLLNPNMTASWEKGLDGIRKGMITKENYHQQLRDYIVKEICKLKTLDRSSELNARIEAVNAIYGKEEKQTLQCPFCKRKMNKFDWGYSCSGYKSESSPCNFSINNKIAGKVLTDSQISEILIDGHSKLIKGFVSKQDKKFDAFLVINHATNKLEFSFPKAKNQ